MIDVKKVEDFEKLTNALDDIATAIENMPEPASGGVDYSTEEQNTGLKWIDGSYIYVKSCVSLSTISIGSAGTNITSYIDNEADILQLIKGEGVSDGSLSNIQCSNLFIGRTSGNDIFAYCAESGTFNVITIWYTKTA